MIPQFLCYLLGPGWRSSLCGACLLVFGFIAASPDLFSKWPLLVALAKYIAVGAGAAGLRAAMDSRPKQ